MTDITHTSSPIPTGTATATAMARPPAAEQRSDLDRKILATIAARTFCTLATTSPAGRPHVAGVVYQQVDGVLWVHASRNSRKARSIAANGHAAICIPFRRLPAGPPFTIHFQGQASIVEMDDPSVRKLIEAGALDAISGHGALDMTDGCFITIRPTGSIHSYGPGARMIDLIRDPLNSGAHHIDLRDV